MTHPPQQPGYQPGWQPPPQPGESGGPKWPQIRPVPPGSTFHADQAPKSRKKLAIGLLVGGALAAIVGFLTMNTKLVLAYKGGTLANVHGLCQNPFAVLGGQKLIQECAAINGWYTFAQVALLGGLLVGVAGLVLLVVVRSQS